MYTYLKTEQQIHVELINLPTHYPQRKLEEKDK